MMCFWVFLKCSLLYLTLIFTIGRSVPAKNQQPDKLQGKDVTDEPSPSTSQSCDVYEMDEPVMKRIKLDEICSTPRRNKKNKLPRGITHKINLLRGVNVSRAQQLTPKAKYLYKTASILKNKVAYLEKKNLSNVGRFKEALQFAESGELLEKKLNKTTFRFLTSQIEMQSKKSRGRRYTLEDKIFALSILKQSPKGYRLLKKVFALPSRKTLMDLLNKIPFSCGLNQAVLESLRESVLKMKDLDKFCILMFDEMSVEAALSYYQKGDYIDGFRNCGDYQATPEFAYHVLVFMARGIHKKWKQPIAYFTTKSGMNAVDLVRNMKQIISALQEVGLKIVATVSDQYTTNVSAHSKLREETNAWCLRNNIENRYFGYIVNGQEIIHLYDCPHLLKGLRNNMIKADVKFKYLGTSEKIARWKDVIALYELDVGPDNFKMCPRLTEQHVYSNKMKKMKVKIAAQVFSQRVSAIMRYLSQKDQEYWYEQARVALRKRLQYSNDRRPHAKNVILFVGDGMGVATTTAARILRGQRLGKTGEDHELAWDTFPAVALAKTYNMDAQIGESSACATALMCGVKTNFETVGLDARGRFENCFSSFSSRVSSLIDWAQESGKSTGIVTNTRITHATPAALYGHSPSRYWEDDSKVPPASRKSCKDLARQLIENDPGRNINVLLGGGRRHWLPKVAHDPEQTKEEGRRLDGRNLIDDWVRDKKKRGLRGEYVWNKGQLDKINPNQIDYLLGLFSYSHMDFEADRDPGPSGDPSLADMTRSALSILLKNPKGFFLVVEGGRIDHAHHYNNAYRALDETLAMETALLVALALVNPTETLIVVTSDHSHVLTMGGQATPRGHPILGPDSKVSDVDGQPYTTILYGNGPGFATPRIVPMNTTSAVEDRNQVHGAAVPRQWGTHGGEDVPVYALGPLATTLFTGTFDQSYIPHAIAYSACLGEHRLRCQGLDNYTLPPVQNCVPSEVSSVSGAGQPVVIASSVMADDGNRVKSRGPKVTVSEAIVVAVFVLKVSVT